MEDQFNPRSIDARMWAKEFNRIEIEIGLQPSDPEWILGWFANAIMAGFDEAKRRQSKWVAERDALAVENRTMLDLIHSSAPLAWVANEDMRSAGEWEKAATELRKSLPHTTREVERVKELEAVVMIVADVHVESHGAIPLSECRDMRCRKVAALDAVNKSK